MNIQKVVTQRNAVKLTAALGLGALAISKTLQNVSEEKTLDYMASSPSALYGKSQILYQEDSYGPRDGESARDFFERLKRGREEIVTTSYSEPFEFDWDINPPEIVQITTQDELDNILNKIKNPKLKDIIQYLYTNDSLYQETADFIWDMDVNSANIEDPVVLDYLDKTYDEIMQTEIEDDLLDFALLPVDISNGLVNASKVIDSYNTIKGNYSQIKAVEVFSGESPTYYGKSSTKEYLDTQSKMILKGEWDADDSLKQKVELYHKTDGKIYDYETKDFIWKQKSEVFENILRESEMKKYLYNLYLRELSIPSEAKDICKEILEKYNVMLLPSNYSLDYKQEFEYIKNELDAWVVASNGEASFPEVINLNSINSEYLNDTGGLHSLINKEISIKNGYLRNIAFALRHELMHENDKLKFKGLGIGEERVNLLKEIMPAVEIDGHKVRDYINCKYREEFLKAGINPGHIDYAYTNRAEFIAVAAEGDLSRYSAEFKDVLIKLGMPEYLFNIKIINPKTLENCHKMDNAMKMYPDAKDYIAMRKALNSLRMIEYQNRMKGMLDELDL